ncbi:hypothetical protein F5X99DRAFT_365238 [Biscogniauxia marginata]|nr:hypothetical protein F5X99DRAFT_365238 [Biscogniauxia marginata]
MIVETTAMVGILSRGPLVALISIILFLITLRFLHRDTSSWTRSAISSSVLSPQTFSTSSSSSPISKLYNDRYGRPTATAPYITKQIWQIFFSPPASTPPADTFQDIPTWLPMAPDWTYTLIGDAGGSSFVEAHFGEDRRDIVEAYHALGNSSDGRNNSHKNLALKSDFLRYLLLFVRGGVYSDLDTRPLAPLDEWVPAERRDSVRLVVAVEYDSPVLGPTEMYPIQFSQWTIASAAGHPVMACMIERALAGLRGLGVVGGSRNNGDSGGAVRPGENAVYNATGPIGWTECVMEGIRAAVESPESFRHANLSGIAEPRYYGDIMVLPDGTFAASLPPGSPKPANGDRVGLVSHAFRGVWKHS